MKTHRITVSSNVWIYPGIILGIGSANESRRYIVLSSLIGWAHTQNNPCCRLQSPPYFGPGRDGLTKRTYFIFVVGWNPRNLYVVFLWWIIPFGSEVGSIEGKLTAAKCHSQWFNLPFLTLSIICFLNHACCQKCFFTIRYLYDLQKDSAYNEVMTQPSSTHVSIIIGQFSEWIQ